MSYFRLRAVSRRHCPFQRLRISPCDGHRLQLDDELYWPRRPCTALITFWLTLGRTPPPLAYAGEIPAARGARQDFDTI